MRNNHKPPRLRCTAYPWLAALLVGVCAPLRATAPAIFFSDLESGPNTGGQDNGGAFVTIYGKNFGTAQGDSNVTVGGGSVAGYALWTDERITVQLGRASATGSIVVRTAAGSSNGVPFTVRPGGIHFVAVNGHDFGPGTFHSPWRTLVKACGAMRPGDITYAMNGTEQTGDNGSGWRTSVLIRGEPASDLPRAVVAYPNAVAAIGGASGPDFGIRAAPLDGVPVGAWVFAGLRLRGRGLAVGAEHITNWRIVGNDISCPQGDGSAACVETAYASGVAFLGNHVHDTGWTGASAMYHAVYFSTDSNHIDVGWNVIDNVHGCRGIQFHSTRQEGDPKSGYNQFDIAIHDNEIHDTQCDGIVLATVDPSRGKVEVYNNVIYDAGKGPDNPDHSGNWSCIYVAGYTNNGSPGGGAVDIFNNTLYNCGNFSHPPFGDANAAISNGGHNPALRIRVRNNILYQAPGVPYFIAFEARGTCRDNGRCEGIYGSGNVVFGHRPPPDFPGLTGSRFADPLFVNLSGRDFHLAAGSPARGAGASPVHDKSGADRAGEAGNGIGAFR